MFKKATALYSKNLSVELFHRLLGTSLLMVAICLSGGCASTDKTDTIDNGEKVSTLPWNTPEKWERSAPLGGGASY